MKCSANWAKNGDFLLLFPQQLCLSFLPLTSYCITIAISDFNLDLNDPWNFASNQARTTNTAAVKTVKEIYIDNLVCLFYPKCSCYPRIDALRKWIVLAFYRKRVGVIIGSKTVYTWSIWTTSRLNGEYLRNETSYRQWERALETTRVPDIIPKFHELWPTTTLCKCCLHYHASQRQATDKS